MHEKGGAIEHRWSNAMTKQKEQMNERKNKRMDKMVETKDKKRLIEFREENELLN